MDYGDWDVPWMDIPYTGAPDECSKHWPTKLDDDGKCSECEEIKDMDKMTYSSHKFGNDPLTEALWIITLNGGQDEEAGTVDDIGWHGLIHVNTRDWSHDVTDDTGDPIRVEIPRGTYIVWSDGQGFVGHIAYEYKSAEASEEWRKIIAAESELYANLCDVCESELNADRQCSWKPDEHLQDIETEHPRFDSTKNWGDYTASQ